MPGRDWDDRRWSGERRDYWREGEDIRSRPGDWQQRGGPERYAGTRDMDFGGGYGGGRDRRDDRSWRAGGGEDDRGMHAGTHDLDDRWDRSRWDRDRAGSRGGERWASSDDDWRRREGDFWERDSEGRLHDWSARSRDEEPGECRRTPRHGRSWGAAWGRGGAGYAAGSSYPGAGGGFGGGGSYGGGRYGRGGEESYGTPYPTYGAEFGAQSWRGDWRSQDRDLDRGTDPRHGDTWRGSGEHEHGGLMDRMREGVARLTGRGPKGYKRSDERIREDVCERIARSPVNAENVEVQVESGEVTLSGEVDSRMDKRRLEDMIDDIFGVDEVHNHLRLRREAHPSSSETGTEERPGEDSGLPH